MKDSDFTVKQALDIQRQQLADWKTKLNAETYRHLSNEVIMRNDSLGSDANGFEVCRGDALYRIISSYHPALADAA